MISEREQQAYRAISRFCTGASIVMVVFVAIALAQIQDARDTEAERQHAAHQAGKEIPPQWRELDARGRQLVAYDQIKK